MSMALRVVGAVLMLAAEACVVLMLFGGEMITCIVLAVVLMTIGVFVWRRGWQTDRDRSELPPIQR
jgi:nicotinamide riboside transporter PnuC